MSYFGNAISELLSRKKMKAVRLAELSGVGQPTISRYISGDQLFVSAEDLDMISSAISDDPVEQAEVIRAHLLDECHGPGSQLIQIHVDAPNVLRDKPPAYQVKLPDNLEQAFAAIREHVIKDKDVRDIIEGLGNLLRVGDCRTMEERGGKISSPAKKEGTAEKVLEDLAEDVSASRGKRSAVRKK